MKKGLTFNDVLLVPKKTPLNSRNLANLKTRFTKNIFLNIPLVSANMKTVTEHKMAIAMARQGGLGVIHQFSTIEEQVQEIKKVKKSTSYVIEDPLSIEPTATLEQAIEKMQKNNITSLLVELQGKLVGILTKRDYLFEDNPNKLIFQLMTKKEKLITAEQDIILEQAKKILDENKIEKLPLVQNQEVKGLITTSDLKKLEHWSDSSRDKKGRLLVGAAVGVKDTLERTQAVIEAGADVIVLDIAHAHSDFLIEKLKQIKSNFEIDVMVGNIATPEAALELIEAGADGLKIGIGSSPVCTTRLIAGAGVPQLTAIQDIYEITKQYNIPICADGGIKFPGDIVKALAAGAETIFSGSLFAGTDQAPERIIFKNGKRYKKYSGSASYESGHERQELQQQKEIKENLDLFVEGVSILVDYKGSVEEVVNSLIKGIKSGMSYCGARNIQELQQNTEFIEITQNSWQESQTQGEKLSE